VADIAVQIAHFHKKVKKFLEEEDVEQIHVRFADIASVSDFLGRHFGPEAESFVEELVQYSADFTGKYASRFQERAQQGFVVDGHGDLHSKNIFLLDKPVIFDCIEFSQEFRRSDVLSDIAFFCMDLDQYGRTDLVTYFMETYLKENPCMQEEADRLIFHYYKMYRANVRLKVNALAAIQFEKEDSLTASRLKEVEVYYLISLSALFVSQYYFIESFFLIKKKLSISKLFGGSERRPTVCMEGVMRRVISATMAFSRS
jgi:aminoglycoside phosphotransferase family enzyme